MAEPTWSDYLIALRGRACDLPPYVLDDLARRRAARPEQPPRDIAAAWARVNRDRVQVSQR